MTETAEWYERVGDALKEYKRAERFAAEWTAKVEEAGKKLQNLGAPIPTSTTGTAVQIPTVEQIFTQE